MSADTVAAFRESLQELGVEFARTTHSASAETNAECVVEPNPRSGRRFPSTASRSPHPSRAT
ncbi:hypothetical protein [Haladaptatus halobius]|uniref:hypothetical protein n=1 Tax=Haladaptatus halobius TaxID=2884875 RepID=UPI001D0BDDBA|nr:hypothetical protein [Haladaptatus halobius]